MVKMIHRPVPLGQILHYMLLLIEIPCLHLTILPVPGSVSGLLAPKYHLQVRLKDFKTTSKRVSRQLSPTTYL